MPPPAIRTSGISETVSPPRSRRSPTVTSRQSGPIFLQKTFAVSLVWSRKRNCQEIGHDEDFARTVQSDQKCYGQRGIPFWLRNGYRRKQSYQPTSQSGRRRPEPLEGTGALQACLGRGRGTAVVASRYRTSGRLHLAIYFGSTSVYQTICGIRGWKVSPAPSPVAT